MCVCVLMCVCVALDGGIVNPNPGMNEEVEGRRAISGYLCVCVCVCVDVIRE